MKRHSDQGNQYLAFVLDWILNIDYFSGIRNSKITAPYYLAGLSSARSRCQSETSHFGSGSMPLWSSPENTSEDPGLTGNLLLAFCIGFFTNMILYNVEPSSALYAKSRLRKCWQRATTARSCCASLILNWEVWPLRGLVSISSALRTECQYLTVVNFRPRWSIHASAIHKQGLCHSKPGRPHFWPQPPCFLVPRHTQRPAFWKVLQPIQR